MCGHGASGKKRQCSRFSAEAFSWKLERPLRRRRQHDQEVGASEGIKLPSQGKTLPRLRPNYAAESRMTMSWHGNHNSIEFCWCDAIIFSLNIIFALAPFVPIR
jgi:hypothetical protein